VIYLLWIGNIMQNTQQQINIRRVPGTNAILISVQILLTLIDYGFFILINNGKI